MRELSMTEPVTLFWRDDLERMQIRPESRYFEKAEDAIRWAFETLTGDQRWSAYLRCESDHLQIQREQLEEHYRRISTR